MRAKPKYEEDFYGWTIANISLLKQGKFNEADMDHIIEEIESLGRSNRRELVSRLGVLIAHLMKWEYQPDLKNKSWKGTIVRQRIDIKDVLEENPSLNSQIDEILMKAYKYALAILEEETPLDLKSVPQKCPYTVQQCLDDEFYPD
jgi:hypothetical protein